MSSPSGKCGGFLQQDLAGTCKLEIHFDKFGVEFRQLAGSQPLLGANDSAKCIGE